MSGSRGCCSCFAVYRKPPNGPRRRSTPSAGFVRSNLPKLYTRELVDALFEQPYCRIENLVESQIAKRQTAASYLRQLVEMGVMGEPGVGREKLFVNTRLLRLLTRDSNEVEVFPGCGG